MTVFDRMLQNLRDRLTKPADKKLNEEQAGDTLSDVVQNLIDASDNLITELKEKI